MIVAQNGRTRIYQCWKRGLLITLSRSSNSPDWKAAVHIPLGLNGRYMVHCCPIRPLINGRYGRGPSVRRPAGFRVLPPLGMPLSAGSSQSEPARQVLPAAGRSWPEAAVCTAEWVSLKLMTRVIITALPTPALSPHLTRSATLACLLARSASPIRAQVEFGWKTD